MSTERRAVWLGLVVLVASGCSTLLGLDGAHDDDRDGDHIPDADDNCPDVANPDQSDIDNNGIGDSCDGCSAPDPTDSDGDGIPDACDGCDNRQPDLNGDGVPDACEHLQSCPGCSPCAVGPMHDEDGDLTPDGCDLCPAVPSELSDADGDGVGDACDPTATPSEQIFDPFTEDDPVWFSNSGAWQVKSDSLTINLAVNVTLMKSFRQLGTGAGTFVVRSQLTGSSLDAIQPARVAVYAGDAQNPNQANYLVECEIAVQANHPTFFVTRYAAPLTPTLVITDQLTDAGPWTVTLTMVGSTLVCRAVADDDPGVSHSGVINGSFPGGLLFTGVYASGAGAGRFDYFNVVSDLH